MKFNVRICFFILFAIPLVASFSWSNCGDPSEPAKITSLDAYINSKKILYVTGRGKLAKNLTSPIQGKIDMQKKFFWGWSKIPCLDNIGSCNYDDVCQLTPYKTGKCPEEFLKNNLPCRCPILEGQYAAKNFPVDLSILPKWIEKGDYRIEVKLSANNEEVMCLLIYIKL